MPLRTTKLVDQNLPVGIYHFRVAANEVERHPKSGNEILRVKLQASRLDDDGRGVVWDRFNIDDERLLWKLGDFLKATGHTAKDDKTVEWSDDALTGKSGFLISRETEPNEQGKRYINYTYCEAGDSRLEGYDEDIDDQPGVKTEPVTEPTPEPVAASVTAPAESNGSTAKPEVKIKTGALIAQLRKQAAVR